MWGQAYWVVWEYAKGCKKSLLVKWEDSGENYWPDKGVLSTAEWQEWKDKGFGRIDKNTNGL